MVSHAESVPVFRVIAIEEAFSVPGVTPPLSRDVIPLQDRWFEEWSRRLPDVAELRLADMDAHGVDMQVLSLTSGVEVITDPAEAVAVARKVNDYLAEVVAAHPTRFAGFAALPLQDPDAAVVELRRAVVDSDSREFCTTTTSSGTTSMNRSFGRSGPNWSALG